MKDDDEFRRIRLYTDGRQQGLRNLAHSIFLNRNAQGMPKRDRIKIKGEARPHLRQAIRCARKSRDLLLAGDEVLHEYERDRARMYAAFARLEFLVPYADKAGKQHAGLSDIRKLGGKATAEKYARPDLDAAIISCLRRGDKTRTYAKHWAAEFNVSADKIERAINRIKGELKKN